MTTATCSYCPSVIACTVADEVFPKVYCLGCYEIALVLRAKSLGGRLTITEDGEVIDSSNHETGREEFEDEEVEQVTNIVEYGDPDEDPFKDEHCDCGHEDCDFGGQDIQDE